MAMVEMVFVLPLLLLLVFAIAQFGLMFSRWLTLSNAVREGAREGVAFRGLVCPAAAATVEANVRDKVVTYANAGGVGISAADVNVAGACGAAGTPLTGRRRLRLPAQHPVRVAQHHHPDIFIHDA